MPDAVRADSAAGLSLTSCVITGGTLNGTWPGALQASGLSAVGASRVSCDQVSAFGGEGGQTCATSVPYPYTWDAPNGGSGAKIDLPAFAFLSGGDFHGRRGSDLNPPCFQGISEPGDGGGAIGAVAAALRCLNVTLQGGTGGHNYNTQCAPGLGPFEGRPGSAFVPVASL